MEMAEKRSRIKDVSVYIKHGGSGSASEPGGGRELRRTCFCEPCLPHRSLQRISDQELLIYMKLQRFGTVPTLPRRGPICPQEEKRDSSIRSKFNPERQPQI